MNIGHCCSGYDSIPMMIHHDGKETSSTTHKERKPSQVGNNFHVFHDEPIEGGQHWACEC